MSHKDLPPLPENETTEKEFKKLSRRRLLKWAVLSLGGIIGIRSIARSELSRGINWPLRKAMEMNDAFWQANFREKSRAQETPPTTETPRLNGDIGMEDSIPQNWKLSVTAPNFEKPFNFSLEEIKALPAVTESFEFKCIEGWSRHVTCKGVRFSAFIQSIVDKAPDDQDFSDLFGYSYAFLSTINGDYYVSMDSKSLWHAQTMLCYEMNGSQLKMDNGYPLRLITSVKYGVKNIKQLGSIAFSDSPPADYWAERGYGDYLGL